MVVDCFIRVFSSNELRLGLAIATVARWKMQQDARVTVVRCVDPGLLNYDFGCDSIAEPNCEIPFATESLHTAENNAESDPYIISNDDCLIYGQDFVQNGLRVMRNNPDFGCVSGAVTNGDQYQLDGPEIHEIHAVGGLVFLRKGLVKEFPPLEDCYWDLERHRQIVQAGFKSGYSKWMPYLHLGARFSVANPAFCDGV